MTRWWNPTHPFDLPQRWTCTLWTPHRRCWTRRLRLESRNAVQVTRGGWTADGVERRRDLLPRGTPETAAIPLISSPNGCGSVSAICGWRQKRTECADAFWNGETKARRRTAAYQENVHQLDQPPTGHKSISQVPDGLDHADQLQGETKKKRAKTLWVRFVLNISSNAKHAYLGFFVADHSCPPLAGRQIEIHGIPRDGSFEPEGGNINHSHHSWLQGDFTDGP